jgi:hypothetical protein
MADLPSLFDNDATTQRIINSSSTPQIFANSANDNSYSLDPSDTNDYFRLQLNTRSSLVLTLNPQNGNADLALLDSSGNPATGILESSTNGGTLADAIVTDPIDPGTYYIRVYTPDNNTSTNYRLTVNTISTSRADLLWRNYGTGENILWQMNGVSFATFLFSTFVGDVNWRIEGTGDFNGDSQADYVWRNNLTGQNIVWFMNGNAYSSFTFLPPVSDPAWNIEGIGDFNNDNLNDLLWRNYTTGDNVVWYMNGTSFVSLDTLPAVPTSWQINAVGNFNGDNSPDIVWRDYATGANVIWLMNGISLTTFTSLPTVSASQGWRIAGASDFDGDGETDIAWRNSNPNDGTNLIWLMNQTSFATFVRLPQVADQNWQIGGVINTAPITDLAGNTMGTAFNIGTLNSSGGYIDSVGTASDTNDYYRFNLSSNGVVDISLSGLTVDTRMQLIQDLNNDGIITTDAEILESITSANGAAQLTSTLATGNYFIRLVNSSATKTDYSLNFSVASAQAIDLAPNAFTVTTTAGQPLPTSFRIQNDSLTPPDPPQSVRVNYSVQNTGVNAVSTFTVSFYLSRDNVITSSDFLFSSSDVVVGSLSPQQSFSGSQDITLPGALNSWWGGDQTYYIGMIVDSAGDLIEISESNNTASAGINIIGTLRPDLVGDGLNIVQNVTNPSQNIQLTGAVRNIGNVSTGSNNFSVRFFFSNDDIWDRSDFLLGSATFLPIAAVNPANPNANRITFDSTISNVNEPSYFLTPLTALPDTTWTGWRGDGTYYVVMFIDRLEVVNEGSGGRENNVNYGRLINQYIDYDFISITGAPNNFISA